MVSSKKKGDIGMGVAIGYYTSMKYNVSIPLTDSQDYDLVVEIDKELKKVQVKYTSYQKNGNYVAYFAVRGGTKGKITKQAEDVDFDILFVTNDVGGRWSIPREFCGRGVILNSKKDQFKV